MMSMPRWTGLVLDVALLIFSWLLLDVPQCNGDPLCFFLKFTLMVAISKDLKIYCFCFNRVGPMKIEVKPRRVCIRKKRTARPRGSSCPEQVCF